MLGGPWVAAEAGRRALRNSFAAVFAAQSVPLEALPPPFLCPTIGGLPLQKGTSRTTAGPSSSSSALRFSASAKSSITRSDALHAAPIHGWPPTLRQCETRSYSSRAATAAAIDDGRPWHNSTSVGTQSDVWLGNTHTKRPNQGQHDTSPKQPIRTRPPVPSSDWRRKFPSTQWRREMDFNRYSPPLRRRHLPEDAPALYEDEIKASAAWNPQSRWTLSMPDDYPMRHELFLILDSLDDISHSGSDPDCGALLLETLRQARELIWSGPLNRPQDRDVALYLAGKVAETYVRLDAEDSMDRLMAFFHYVQAQIGLLPLACFHALAAQAGITRRYDAVLRICQVAESHHGGKADAELLHLRLRALVAQSRDVDLTRYWDRFSEAGVSVPRKTFDLLLRTHVRRQDVEQLNQVLETMPKHGHEVDAKAWLTIFRGFQTFRPSLAAMLKRDAKLVQSPTLDVVNRLLLLLARELDVNGALMVLRICGIPSLAQSGAKTGEVTHDDGPLIINGPSPQPNAQTYAALTQMFGRLGRPKEALGFFRLALSAFNSQGESVVALQRSTAHVMRAHLNAGSPFRAMWFATQSLGLPYFGSAESKKAPLIDFKLTPLPRIRATTLHYRILLECASAIGSAEMARRIVVDLLQHGHTIDQQVLSGLARLIFSTIDQDALESIRVIRRLLPGGKEARDTERSQRLGSLSDLLQRLGASDKVVLASHHAADLECSTDSIESKSKGKPRSISSSSLNTASKDELRRWLIQDSSSLFRGISSTHDNQVEGPALAQDLSRPLSPDAYAMRIRVYAVVRRDYASAQKVYHAMLSHRVQPTMMHIAPLIEGLIAVGKLDEAQRLKRNAREVTSLEPTLRIHTALIRAYIRAGDSNAARKEIQELTKNGFEIDDTIANIIESAQSGRRNFALVDRPITEKNSHSVATRFLALIRMRRYLAAQEMLQAALDAGVHSDRVLHDLVRRSVSYVDKEHAKALAITHHASSDLTPAKAVSAAAAAADGKRRKDPKTAGSEGTSGGSHVFELAQALRLARRNQERITKSMSKHSEVKRKKIKEHRKKVVSLILDFADGKLHQQAELKQGEPPI